MPRGDRVKMKPELLSAAAIRNELTRREIREKAGVSDASVAQAFAGRPLSIKTARAIARALDTSVVMVMESPAAVTAA